jgi:hypothetical protein
MGMDLKDFVKQALLDIAGGVEAARQELPKAAVVGNSNRFKIEKLPANVLQDHSGALYSVIEFDVAVTSADAVEGGGGINVLSFKVGAKVEGKSETVSRLQFPVTIRLE